jgi:hypothetical protein
MWQEPIGIPHFLAKNWRERVKIARVQLSLRDTFRVRIFRVKQANAGLFFLHTVTEKKNQGENQNVDLGIISTMTVQDLTLIFQTSDPSNITPSELWPRELDTENPAGVGRPFPA